MKFPLNFALRLCSLGTFDARDVRNTALRSTLTNSTSERGSSIETPSSSALFEKILHPINTPQSQFAPTSEPNPRSSTVILLNRLLLLTAAVWLLNGVLLLRILNRVWNRIAAFLVLRFMVALHKANATWPPCPRCTTTFTVGR